MKKSITLFVTLVVSLFILSLSSCREKSTSEKVEDGVEEVGDELEEAGDEVEDGMEEMKEEAEDAVDDN
ncbi:hypothetical protein FK220_016870 [Flavobacteriaceae bacterium TP-CH-4]|uniref:Uncharacterized protein n=1 Tax=Pelagihabitans pacificus TaxID=2696054 RepID=A0A967AW49_9FLAO|nr:hypothetical protein [Pelagihabitans pacificus]NHF61027.1 hypothetical protein [Pelagihabitans pacificus]